MKKVSGGRDDEGHGSEGTTAFARERKRSPTPSGLTVGINYWPAVDRSWYRIAKAAGRIETLWEIRGIGGSSEFVSDTMTVEGSWGNGSVFGQKGAVYLEMFVSSMQRQGIVLASANPSFVDACDRSLGWPNETRRNSEHTGKSKSRREAG